MAEQKIRFKGFEKEWEVKKMSNILIPSKTKNFLGKYTKKDVLSVSGEFGIVNQIEFQGRSFAGQSVLNYGIVNCNDIVYTKSPLKSNPYGIIKTNKGKAGIVSTLYAVYKCQDKVCPYFVQYYFELDSRLNSYLRPLVRKGAKNDMKVSSEDALLGDIVFPLEVEQQQIASYFKSLDNLIQEATKKISSFRQLKAASLQSMFPQAGETKPRVRFKGFDGEWVKSNLNQFASRITRKNLKLESQLPLTISAVDGLVSQSLFFNSIVASSNLSKYYLIKEGEFAYNKSYSNGYPFGAVKRLEKYNMGALSTLYIVFALNNNISSDYLVHFFDTTLWHGEVAKRAAEGARNHGLLNISAEDFLDIEIVFPASIDEQQHIADFFRSLDTQISLETQHLDKLKQIKSACLDKMFV